VTNSQLGLQVPLREPSAAAMQWRPSSVAGAYKTLIFLISLSAIYFLVLQKVRGKDLHIAFASLSFSH